MNNAYITKKPTLPTHRTLHSQKKLAQARPNPTPNAPPTAARADRRAFLEFIPSDEALIEEYIEELRHKLQQIRASPKRKPARLETQQIFKRKYSEQSGSKSKGRSNDGSSRGRNGTESAAFQSSKKSALLDLKQARDEFKRSKQGLAERRVVTEKQKENHRYSEDKPLRTQSKAPQAGVQSCDLRVRSNTEVLRSQKNPARIYRYSSLKKAPCMQEGNVSNNFLFDKLISVHHNINIRLDDHSHSPRERLRREPNEQASHEKEKDKREAKSPKKGGEKNKVQSPQKIGDLSTINARKQTLNFLGESCLVLKEQFAQKQQKEVSKILDFLGWKTNQMRKALNNLKQKKRKNGLDKLGKIFPKGFFP